MRCSSLSTGRTDECRRYAGLVTSPIRASFRAPPLRYMNRHADPGHDEHHATEKLVTLEQKIWQRLVIRPAPLFAPTDT